MSKVPLQKKILSSNDRIAAELREAFDRSGILALNLISSPGAGKTSLLERTLETFDSSRCVALLTGDIQTDNDAARLAKAGFPVRQITTEGACHLDARMVLRGLEGWNLADLDLLFIENVGNLVCPASYDLGEAAKVVLLSVTEGDDKPLKYPSIFTRADLLVLNKIDLLPYVHFDVDAALENARKVNPQIDIVEVSCTTGEGLDDWTGWFEARTKT